MDVVLKDMLLYVLSYALVIGIAFFLLQWLSNGFFLKFLRVKASRGQLVMVNVRSKLQHYFVHGKIEGDFLVFHDRESKANKQKEPKRARIPDNRTVFYRAFGVNVINVDEATNNVIAPDMGVVPGFDAIKYSSLYTRALYKPSLAEDDVTKKLVIGVLIVTILLVLGLILIYTKLGSLNEAFLGVKSVVGTNIP